VALELRQRHMRRREFLGLLGGAAATWPFVVHAQQQAMPVVGYLIGGTPETLKNFAAAFRETCVLS
jgi:hypothetical protein